MKIQAKLLHCFVATTFFFTTATGTTRAEEYLSYNRTLLSKLNPAIQEQKEFQDAYKLYCQSFNRGAEAAFKTGVSKFPKSPYFSFGLACIDFSRQDYPNALLYANSALEKNPKFLDAIKLRGIIYSAQEKPELALKEFETLASAAPTNPIVCRLKGMAELECARVEQAKAEMSKGLKIAPKDRDLLFLKANILYWDGNYTEALTCINATLPFNYDEPYLLRSKILTRLNRFDEAIADLNSASKIGHWSYRSRKSDIEDFRYDLKNAETEPSHLWALACAAPLFTQNNDGLQSLSGVVPNAKNVSEEKKRLIEWWGIHNNSEMIATVKSLNKDGHNQAWFNIKAQLETPVSFLPLTFAPERAKVVKEYGEKFGSRGIRAWDLSRSIAICRWGYRCGYLTRQEAFDLIMPHAKLIQETYSSWKQFAFEYYVGRLFWDKKIYLEDKNRTELNVHQLLNDPQSPWRRLDWNTPLDK